MIFHVVRFALRPDLPEAEAEECMRLLRAQGDVDSTVLATVCRDLGGADEMTHVSIAAFENEEQYVRFHRDPFHTELIKYVIPRLERLSVLDAAEDSDSGLGERLRGAQADSPAITPEIVAHMTRALG